MWMVGLCGLVLGIFLILLVPRFLPFSVDSHVASLVMGRDTVSAGYAMMGAADPTETSKMEWRRRFYDGGGQELSECLKTARQTGQILQCTVTVGPPVQQ